MSMPVKYQGEQTPIQRDGSNSGHYLQYCLFSYSGASNYGLTLKWRQLNSQSTPGAETLLNLIWTDLVAFTIVGTRTGFGDDDKPGNLGVRRVHRYERSVRYGDIRFAIPAFIVGAFLLVTLVISLLM